LGVVLAISFVGVACGDSGGSTSTGAGKVEVDRNAEITLLTAGAPTTLDPAKLNQVGQLQYVWAIYDRLVARDVDNNLKPMVATDWSFSPDGRALTMNLRQDVKFNDGTPLTSADVKVSIERAQTLTGTVWAVQLKPITSIETASPYQVRFNLSRPAGELPAVFSMPAGAVINSKTLVEGRNMSTNPGRAAGSGPMVVETFSVNDRVVYVRAGDSYWDPAANQLAKVTLAYVPDATARLNALQGGQADLIQVRQATSDQAKALAKQGRFKYHDIAGVQQISIFLNSRRAPLDKLEVRQALNYAIDRAAITQFMSGDCPAATQLFQKGQAGYDPALDNQYSYDPGKARQLLKQAGLENGFNLSMSFPAGSSPYVDQAPIIQEQLAKIGVRLSVNAVDGASIVPQFSAGSVDAMLLALGPDADPALTVDKFFLSGTNLAGAFATDISALATSGKDRTVPVAVWQQKYRDIAGIAGSKALHGPVCNLKGQYLYNNKLSGVETMAGQLLAGYGDTRYLAVTR
jgi:peptide/nickel transport system substrate-binding protein